MRFFIDGYRRLLTHPRYGIWVLLATLLYLVSPIDLSPDVLPLLGQIDDVALIVLLVSAASQWLSQQFLQAQSADSGMDTPIDQPDIRQTIDVDAIEVDSSEA
jgi:uncharacterized membrane protein YkvA (DUF1232 family)